MRAVLSPVALAPPSAPRAARPPRSARSPRLALPGSASFARARASVGTRGGSRAAPLSSPARASSSSRASSSPPAKATATATNPLGRLFGGLFGGGAGGGDAERARLKAALLDALEGLERGVSASEAQRDAVDAAARALEARNPNRACLRSPAARALLSGEWELLYTTSASILGATRPWPFRPLGPIFQTIDVDRLRARNRETFPFFNAVDADLTPSSASAVDVQFVTFYVFGFIEVTAPASARGALDVTYLDEELRVSRGDRGNLFVLRMADDAKRLPRKGDV